ncbi:MAG: ABC transporter ATP-binding protein [Parachlamydiales bacterium]|jgi:iron complex transport system ATP-binding protein
MLKIRHLSCVSGKKTLISGVSLDLSHGSLWGVVGPNGAGKTSLLRAIAGLIPVVSGEIIWDDTSLHAKSRQEISKIVTFVPQQPPLQFDFQVKEVVAMGRYSHTRNYHNEWDNIMEALEAVDMIHHADSLINELSSGERQRVYIARALVSCAPIVLLDEPTASLDIRHQLEIWDLLLQLRDQQRTVIVTHHDLAAAYKYCRQIVVMHNGQCVAQGPTNMTLTPSLVEEVFGVTPIGNSNQSSFRLADKSCSMGR